MGGENTDIKESMQKVVNYLEDNYKACLDCCGENDDINTLPAKQAYEDAKQILSLL